MPGCYTMLIFEHVLDYFIVNVCASILKFDQKNAIK
jgi:hypothetical protein